MTAEEKDRALRFVESQEWIFAKTMAEIPHYYCLKKRIADPEEFFWFVRLMEANSEEGQFYGKTYRYFYLGEWKYWMMDPTPEECDLINREKLCERL